MLKKYVIVVRDKISIGKQNTDEALINLNCYYKSPVFFADGTWQSFDKALDEFYHHFKHFIGWSAEMIEVL
jgi:hypothetical protein